jgi:PSP1 C-terminal conserved region
LGALRDRANSSPGPVQILSTSPPVGVAPRGGGGGVGHFLAHQQPPGNHGYVHPHDVHSERSRHRDRPPLSHSYQDGMSGMGSGMGFVSVSSNRSASGDPNNTSMDSADSRGFGAIGRPPDFRPAVSAGGDLDPNRRRAASTGDSFHAQYAIQNGVPDSAVAHKFGTLPTLGTHIQQQRMPEGMPMELQRPRHIRSVSQPMPNNGPQYQPAPGMDGRYNAGAYYPEGHSYPGENRYKQGSSASNPAMSMFVEGAPQQHYTNQKRVSLPSLGNAQGYIAAQQHPGYSHSAPAPRRDIAEYHMSPHGSIATGDDGRSYPSMISPGHSPLQVHYAASGGHSRHNSDAGSSTMLSSSPRSISATSLPGNMMSHRRQFSGGGGDDDFAHPLLGEHIDVPAEHDELYNAYSLAQSTQRHTHSMSLGELPSQYIEASHHLPTAGAGLPAPKVVYSVKFKRTQRNFVLGPRISRDLKIGTYVKVEADRGEDLGIVVGKLPADKYSFSRSSFASGLGPPGLGAGNVDLKRIIRLATHDEVSLLSMKRDEEEELLKICRAKVRQRGLPMHVVDAEYQFDRHKLTFFFEAEGRVDFRELVRDLFSMYKTRIWMQQLDKNTANASQAMISPHPSALQMDYGTPIIAPVSEFADSIVLSGMSLGDGR